VAIFQLHAKHGVGQGIDHRTLHRNNVFFSHGSGSFRLPGVPLLKNCQSIAQGPGEPGRSLSPFCSGPTVPHWP
jgi:hypothetical protein